MTTRNDLIEFITCETGMTDGEAELVIDSYVSQRIIKISAHDGYRVSHGAFLEPDVLRMALDNAWEAEREERYRHQLGRIEGAGPY